MTKRKEYANIEKRGERRGSKKGYNRIREQEWLRGKGVRRRIKSKQEESGINH